MKKLIAIIMLSMLIFGLTACSSKEKSDNQEKNTKVEVKESKEKDTEESTTEAMNAEEENTTEQTTETVESGKQILVAYFSATGTTKDIAEKIADITDADLYEIKPLQEYTDADLDWNDSDSRTTEEQNDSTARPEIASEQISLEGYTTIYLGYPIWWGEEPRIMDSFVESYNFDGMTIIPFCTSASSDIGISDQNLKEHAGSGDWLSGQRFARGTSEEDIESWINSLQ